jgi:hypothetical protein
MSGFRLRVLPRAQREDPADRIDVELEQKGETHRLAIACEGKPIRCQLVPDAERR